MEAAKGGQVRFFQLATGVQGTTLELHPLTPLKAVQSVQVFLANAVSQ